MISLWCKGILHWNATVTTDGDDDDRRRQQHDDDDNHGDGICGGRWKILIVRHIHLVCKRAHTNKHLLITHAHTHTLDDTHGMVNINVCTKKYTNFNSASQKKWCFSVTVRYALWACGGADGTGQTEKRKWFYNEVRRIRQFIITTQSLLSDYNIVAGNSFILRTSVSLALPFTMRPFLANFFLLHFNTRIRLYMTHWPIRASYVLISVIF